MRILSGRRSPAMATRLRGATSASTTVDAGNSPRLLTGRPHSTAPPTARSSATRASAIACEPPSASGQPATWPSAREEDADAGGDLPVERQDRMGGGPGEQRRSLGCRRTALGSARVAERRACSPKRAILIGCRGGESGDNTSSTRPKPPSTTGANRPCPGLPVGTESSAGRVDRPLQQAPCGHRADGRAGRPGEPSAGRDDRGASCAGPAKRCRAGAPPNRRRARSRVR